MTKTIKLLRVGVMLTLMGSVMSACHSKIDVSDVDTTSDVSMGLALPVGSMTVTMGDFLGDGQVKGIAVDEDGIFHYIDTFKIEKKKYRKVNPADYIIKNKATLNFKVEEQVSGSINGDGSSITTMKFPLSINLEGINKDTSDERIDSMWVSRAAFITRISKKNFDIKWNELKSVKLILGDQFKREKGKVIEIPIDGKDFTKGIEFEVDNFYLCLMKDPSNVDKGTVDVINFEIQFEVCADNDHNIPVTAGTEFNYDLQIVVLDYNAMWGYFEAGSDMRDAQRVDMDSLWPEWRNIKKLKVRFAEPFLEVFVSHKVAAPLRMYIDGVAAIDSAGNKKEATWGGKTAFDFQLDTLLSPLSPLTDSVCNYKKFSSHPAEGHIDELFDVRPDFFDYSFHLNVDKNGRADYPWKQHRITNDLSVNGFARIDVPFKFNEGSEAQYSTTIKDVDLSDVDLDSLLADSKMVDSLKATDLKLFLTVYNSIPFDIDGYFTFLDKDSVDMKLQLVQDNDSNRLHFPAPELTKPAGSNYGYVSKPSETVLIVSVDKNDFDRLSKIKYIHLNAAITGNPQPCVLDVNTCLKVHIGVSANVEGVFNFNDKNK